VRAETSSAIGLDASGGFVVQGRPTFLIALSNPPPLSGRTPAGRSGPVEVVRTGVNLVRVGPTWTGWTRREVAQVNAWDHAAMRLGIHTWVRLNAFAATHPRWRGDAHLSAIVHALTRSPFAAGIGLWQGSDEPWSRGIPARSLAFVYCRLTFRGDARACAGEPPLDRRHLLVTIMAPHGSPADLEPYRAVTDSLGVDVYPVTMRTFAAPPLHDVGIWTHTIADISHHRAVWTTLQICSTHQYDARTGAFVMPTAYEERYMVYDAIINGTRAISFFGGGDPHCWNRLDRRRRWNWTFWNRVLDPLIEQIDSDSPLGPALDNAGSTHVLRTSAAGSEAISRVALTEAGRQLWVIASRGGVGAPARAVTVSGLPAAVRSAVVYGEGRSVRVAHGVLRDTFRRWQVHVYRLQLRSAAFLQPHAFPQVLHVVAQ
jgi:hypothetical protein